MKRLTIILLASAALTTSAWAITPTERGMNNFSGVSQPKYARESQPTANDGMPSHSYNKAIEEHKARMTHADHGKHGKKPHHKKQHHS